jgi:hypothetical protein
MMEHTRRPQISGTALAALLLPALLCAPPGCFLPDWDERPWVGDDDDTTLDDDDDDATADDDTTPPDEILFEGTLDVSVTYPGVVNSDCQTSLPAEYDIPAGTLEGETSCQLAQLPLDFELDADIAGTAVTGQLDISDTLGELPFALEATVTGSYDADQGHISGQADLNWYGVLVHGTFELDEI